VGCACDRQCRTLPTVGAGGGGVAFLDWALWDRDAVAQHVEGGLGGGAAARRGWVAGPRHGGAGWCSDRLEGRLRSRPCLSLSHAPGLSRPALCSRQGPVGCAKPSRRSRVQCMGAWWGGFRYDFSSCVLLFCFVVSSCVVSFM